MSTNAPQGTLAAMLEVARRNIGYIEGPNNSNPYAKVAGHANHQPWCATFLVAVARRAGVKIPNESAYTPTMSNGFKAAGRWYGAPAVGDFVFFHWPSMGRIAHVGIVEQVNADGTIIAIEGNTDSAGGRTGGRVMRQVRQAHIAGYGRPVYAQADAPAPPAPPKPTPPPAPTPARYPGRPLRRGSRGKAVQAIQRKLGIKADGIFGLRTFTAVVRFQGRMKLRRDGIVGPATWKALFG